MDASKLPAPFELEHVTVVVLTLSPTWYLIRICVTCVTWGTARTVLDDAVLLVFWIKPYRHVHAKTQTDRQTDVQTLYYVCAHLIPVQAVRLFCSVPLWSIVARSRLA